MLEPPETPAQSLRVITNIKPEFLALDITKKRPAVMVPKDLDLAENRRRMLAGELYYAFTPDLTADRMRAKAACNAFNEKSISGEASRRTLVELWKKYVMSLPVFNSPSFTFFQHHERHHTLATPGCDARGRRGPPSRLPIRRGAHQVRLRLQLQVSPSLKPLSSAPIFFPPYITPTLTPLLPS